MDTELFWIIGYYKWCCHEHYCMCILIHLYNNWDINLWLKLLCHRVRSCQTFPKQFYQFLISPVVCKFPYFHTPHLWQCHSIKIFTFCKCLGVYSYFLFVVSIHNMCQIINNWILLYYLLTFCISSSEVPTHILLIFLVSCWSFSFCSSYLYILGASNSML